MKNEIAFKAQPESALYKNYFTKKNEEAKFKKLAISFINAHIPEKFDGEMAKRRFSLSDTLAMDLSPAEAESLHDQLCKKADYNGCRIFKRRSAMDKLWVSEVCSKVNRKALNANDLWFYSFEGRSSCFSWSACIWDDPDGNVYGIVGNDGEIQLPAGVSEIKMSEYYSIVEKLEAEGKIKKA